MEEAAENGKELSHFEHGNGMKGIYIYIILYTLYASLHVSMHLQNPQGVLTLCLLKLLCRHTETFKSINDLQSIINTYIYIYIYIYRVILTVLGPRKCKYLKDYSLDFEHAYMTTYLAS
jgi:uncharacterized membrane protein